MKLTVYDRKANTLAGQRDRLANLIESETRFGMGCEFKERRDHDVMDEDWGVSQVTQRLHDKAWSQLGTSGSGNHFVEFGAFTVEQNDLGLEPGEYLALLTHSGSRGTGAQVCDFYSKRAMARHEHLPKELKHLAWLCGVAFKAGQKRAAKQDTTRERGNEGEGWGVCPWPEGRGGRSDRRWDGRSG